MKAEINIPYSYPSTILAATTTCHNLSTTPKKIVLSCVIETLPPHILLPSLINDGWSGLPMISSLHGREKKQNEIFFTDSKSDSGAMVEDKLSKGKI